jgi:hypothetical protein
MKWGRRISLGLALCATCVGPANATTLKLVPARTGHLIIQLSGKLNVASSQSPKKHGAMIPVGARPCVTNRRVFTIGFCC